MKGVNRPKMGHFREKLGPKSILVNLMTERSLQTPQNVIFLYLYKDLGYFDNI